MPIYLEMISYLFLVFLTSYLIGSFNAAYLVARLNNIDISNEGSGNPGTANILRVLGKKMAILVLLLDVFKGFIVPYWWAMQIKIHSPYLAWDSGIYMAAFAVAVGHCYPLYYKFKGGKGVASYVGFLLFLFYWTSIIEDGTSLLWISLLLVIYVIVLKSTKTSALASLSVVFSSTFIFYDFLTKGSQPNYGWNLFLLTVLLIFWRHKDNFGRLSKGDENKF